MFPILTDFVTPTEAARIVGCTPYRVRQLVDAGQLPAVMTPLGRLLPKSAIEAYGAARAARRGNHG